FPLIPCRKCDQCLQEKYEMCRDYDYLGSRSDGAFAEYVSVPVSSLTELPDGVSYEAAAMLEPMAVAVHAIRQAVDLKETDRDKRIAVYGLGTIGLFVLMFLKGEGFDNIIVIGNKEEQKKRACGLFDDEGSYYDGRDPDVSDKIRAAGGADIVFECVGRNETLEGALKIIRPSGSLVTIGNPYGDMTLKRDIYWKILRDQLTLKGTWNSSFTGRSDDDWHYVLGRLKNGRIDPSVFISHRYPLKDLDKGLMLMRDKLGPYVKVMVHMV
ncbi:MAG: zinc-binding dehydrogenase, partial [Lachnospiraceae bacterium]|nr:zinc-binding dehydrogenase [Lachnospiraceae bacterium]